MAITDLKYAPSKKDEDNSAIKDLRTHLGQGAEQARSDNFVVDFSMDNLIQDLDKEA